MRLGMSETPKAAQKWMADGRLHLMQFLFCPYIACLIF